MNAITLLFLLMFLVYVDLRILTPLLPSIASSLGSSPGAVGLAMTSYSFTYGFGQLVYGPLSDRLGRIVVVRTAAIGFCLFTVLSALATTIGQFVVLRLIAGVFAGAVIPLTALFVADTVTYGQRQAVLGRMFAISSVAMILSWSIGGTVAQFVSWRAMLIGYGLLALIPLGLLWRIQTDRPAEAPINTGRFKDYLRDRRALFIYIGVFLEGSLLWGGMTYVGAFAIQRYGLDHFTVGLLIAAFGFGTMMGGLAIGRLRHFLSENVQVAVGGLLMGGSFLVLIPHTSLWVFVASMFTMGLGVVGLHTTLQLRATEISSTSRGKAFSLFAVGNLTGIGTGSAAFGWFVNAGLYEAMLLTSGIGLILTGLAMALTPQRQDSRQG